MAHEEALEGRQAVDGGETQVAHQAHGRHVVREQPVEAVGRRQQGHRVQPPPALIARQHVGRAQVEAEAPGLDQHLGQRGHVAQSQVEALAGDGVHGVGGLAHQGKAAVHVALGIEQREGIVPARPHHLERTQVVAETLRDLALETGLVERQHRRRQLLALGPHQGRAVAREGEDGEGARRQKTLLSDAAVGARVGDGADDAALAVTP